MVGDNAETTFKAHQTSPLHASDARGIAQHPRSLEVAYLLCTSHALAVEWIPSSPLSPCGHELQLDDIL